jgi:AbrB family looped-hinge helix DNA binding protein
MKAKISTKGQVVIPHHLRNLLGILAGDEVTIKSSQQRIIMEKVGTATEKPKLILRKGKMPILKMPRNSDILTPEMVKEIAQI